MEQPGDWKQLVVSVAPFLFAGGIVLANPLLAAVAAPHPAASLAASLGGNLLASGISALCKPGSLRASQDYQEQLANHDILRMIRTSWGEAAASTVAKYVEKHPDNSVSLKYPRPPAEFLKLLRQIQPEDFYYSEQITLGTVRDAIAASRRALMPAPDSSPAERDIKRHIDLLNSGLIDSVCDAIQRRPGGRALDLPVGFRGFLAGEDPRFSDGILGQLCTYVALHLKTDTRAQVAVLHFTLQDLSDRQVGMQGTQHRIEELCRQIYQSQNESQRALLKGFEERNKDLCDKIDIRINQAFNRFVSPRFDPAFEADSARQVSSFTYRARATPFVGREAAMDALLQFMADPRQGLWTVISGPAGSGKNRLAAELVAMVSDGRGDFDKPVPPGQWRAGFLRLAEDWLRDKASYWTPDADTLIVTDYAGELDRPHLSDLLAPLNRSRELPECRVRVILLDRLPPDTPLGLVTRLLSGNDRQKEIADNRWRSPSRPTARPQEGELPRDGAPLMSRLSANSEGSGDPLALHPVTEANALQIAKDWSGSKWTLDVQNRVQQALRHDTQLARPLFAALIGDAIRTDDLPPGVLNPVSVGSTALRRLFYTHAHGPEGQSDDAKILLAAVTVAQGLAKEDLFDDHEVLCGITGETHLSDSTVVRLERELERVTGPWVDQEIPPLEPDFLGGLFVLERLLYLPKKRALAKADLLTRLAWERGRSPGQFLVRLASDFMGRAEQLAEAMAHEGEPSGSMRVNELLAHLILSGLSTEALQRI